MKDNLDWVHHDSKTVNENYYQVLEGTRSYGKTYGSINEINVNNIIIERNKAVKEIERLNNIINELYSDLKTLWIVLWNMDTEMTGYQNEIFDKYYDEFHKEKLKESEK